MSTRATPEQLRDAVQAFVRSFGLLSPERTPCGQPISVSEAHALMLLLAGRGQGPPPSVGEMCKGLSLDKSNVTRVCARLAGRGLVALEVSQHDRRVKLVKLTAKGLRVARTVDQASRQEFASVLAHVPRAARSSVIDALDELVKAVRESRSSTTPS